MTAPEGTPAPTLPDLCRAAATAIETLCATLRDCAREVEARGGQRVARGRLGKDKQRVDEALWALRCAAHGPLRQEPHEMWQGVVDGYVRPTWALRLMQLAAESKGPLDTVPAEATVCMCGDAYPVGHPKRCKGIATHRAVDYPSTFSCDEHSDMMTSGLGWERIDAEAPEEHAGEGGT